MLKRLNIIITIIIFMENLIIVSMIRNVDEIVLAHNHLISLRRAGYLNTITYCSDSLLCSKLNENGFKCELIAEERSSHAFSYVRFVIIRNLLEQYEKVWYMDIDSVIVGNILESLDNSGDWDIQFEDAYLLPCVGNIVAKNTEKTKQLLEKIYERKNDEYDSQYLFSHIIGNRKLNLPIQIKIMSIYTFCPGFLYFPDTFLIPLGDEERKRQETIKKLFVDTVQKDKIKKPVFIHGNYIKSISDKISAFKKYNLWFI